MSSIDSLLSLLEETPDGPFFNPWYQTDANHDIDKAGADIRHSSLKLIYKNVSTAANTFLLLKR
ncbi:MAG: hypothetical protein U5J63_08830 [Fodinibius sp.]|nr:hypothetical protein [Fodinibius sp.]